MGRPVKGDVVVVPFPFSNLAATKKRPALVIAPLNTHDDVILCMITSRNTADAKLITRQIADRNSSARVSGSEQVWRLGCSRRFELWS